jgi:serine/threonine-protein kinase HipA
VHKKQAFSLSPHIALRGEAPHAGTVQRFIANLLPEGRALDVASYMFQISKNNTFGLIRMLGKEPVGALSFLALEDDAPAGEVPRKSAVLEPVRRVISNEELTERIRDRDAIPFPVWDGKVRLSVAGYQDKLQVMVEGDQLALVEGALSSTHILKPESRSLLSPCMVANEHFCMTLARQMGLPVAPVELRRIPEPILLIERFDRIVKTDPDSPGQVRQVLRRHVIDGCQALDLPVSFKYERNFGNTADVQNIREGVSFQKLFSLAPHFDLPAGATAFLVRWAILQLLIGNSDAHGKNVSFFVQGRTIKPAPLYDLVSINVYGDAFRLEEVTAFELAAFAHRTGTRPAFLARELKRMATMALNLAPEQASSDVYVGEEKALVKTISDFICTQATHLLKWAPMVPKVDTKLL